MGNFAERIADSELEIMKVLWAAGEPLPVSTIRTAICERTGWESSTVKTLLYRLTEKGAVRQEKRDVYYFTPCVSEREYNEYMTQALIDRLYKSSAKNLVASLLSSSQLSAKDLEELQNMFREGSHE